MTTLVALLKTMPVPEAMDRTYNWFKGKLVINQTKVMLSFTSMAMMIPPTSKQMDHVLVS